VGLRLWLGFPKSHNLRGEWSGWGTALKPAWEPIILTRKPLIGTVAENVLKYGTGAINVDGCRVAPTNDVSGWSKTGSKASENRCMSGANYEREPKPDNPSGRWPANIIHDGSEEVVGLFPVTTSGDKKAVPRRKADGDGWGMSTYRDRAGDSGSAARFFYSAKASRAEREAGLEGMDSKLYARSGGAQGAEARGDSEYLQDSIGLNRISKVRNHHPTVKPLALMRYLCRLVTPPGGIVLDPFMGSGTTGVAAKLEGFEFIGIEKEKDYHEIARSRINNTGVQK